MQKLVLILSLILLVRGEWTVSVAGYYDPFSVDPECDYAKDVCGPIFNARMLTGSEGLYALFALGSGIAVADATASDNAIIDVAPLCPGQRSMNVVQTGANSFDIWTLGSSEYCDCQNETCHHFKVDVNGVLYDAIQADLTTVRITDTPLVGELAVAEPEDGCFPLENPEELAGKVALIKRGGCAFSTKFQNALDAGAIAVIVGNVYYNDPFTSIIGMAGYGVDIAGVMVDKFAYEDMVAAVAAGTSVATFGTEVGADVVDDRYQPFDGVTKISFDGTSFGKTETWPELFDTEIFYGNSLNYFAEKGWLILSLQFRDDRLVFRHVILDVSTGSPQVLGYRDGPALTGGFEVEGDMYFYSADKLSTEMNVWMANTVDDFATVESYVSQNIAPGASWFDGGYAYDNSQFLYTADQSFGGGINVVDVTYLPEWYSKSTFWAPDWEYDTTSADNVFFSPSMEILVAGGSSEGVSFWNVSANPARPTLMASFDTMPNREFDWTVLNYVVPFSEVDYAVFTSHDGVYVLHLEEEADCPAPVECEECEVCEVCEVCEDDGEDNSDDVKKKTQINFNFGGMI